MTIKKTITSIFLVPTLKIPKESLKDNEFINGYSNDKGSDLQYDDSIYLLFKPKNLDRFREFLESEYERTKDVLDDYNYEDGFVVVVYKLDVNFKSDFSLIREGKYSKTSPSFQALFPRVTKIVKNGLHRDEISLQYRIFNKTEDLVEFWEKEFGMSFDKSYEVWNGFNIENETLDIEQFKIKENV